MRSVFGWLKSAGAALGSISFSGKQGQLAGACVNCYSRRTRCLTSHRSMVDRFTRIAGAFVVAVATSAYGSAGVIINFSQVGSDVKATVSGSLSNLSGGTDANSPGVSNQFTLNSQNNLFNISTAGGSGKSYNMTRGFGSFVAWSSSSNLVFEQSTSVSLSGATKISVQDSTVDQT